MSALETLVELRRELDVFTRQQVSRGLAGGRSFGDLARALRISRQAAHRRFRDLAPAQGQQLVMTQQARRVLRFAREEVVSTNAAALGGEHVLIAVLRCGGDAAQALIREGATLERVRGCERALAADRGRPSGFGASQSGLRGVLRQAMRVASARGERWLDVDVLLLAALADPAGGAARVLAALAVDVTVVRDRVGCAPEAQRAWAADGRRRGDAA